MPDIKAYRLPDGALTDRCIVVTGAGDGIGRAVAIAAAAHGARVTLLGRTTSKLEATYDTIVEAGGPRPAICPFDLHNADPNAYQAIADGLEKEYGRLDGLVHNAGILGQRTPIEHADPSRWQEVMQVNLTAPFLLTKPCLPLLKRSEDASVIFVSSGVGRRGSAYWGAYAVSKFGVEGLMEVLADELEENTAVRVNSLNPGRTRTSMRASAYPAEDPETLLTAEDIVQPFLYLLGPDSRGVTGRAFEAQ